MRRMLYAAYGAASYTVFSLTYLYFIGFLANLAVPKSIDSPATTSFIPAFATDLSLIALFAVQHSVMARAGFKTWLKQYLPESLERSTYVLVSSLVTIFLFRSWLPMTETVWRIDNPAAQFVLTTLFWGGWALIVGGSFLIDHFELFGLRQIYAQFTGKRHADTSFAMPFLYKVVRHPIMLGKVLVFWSAAHMTAGHALFAVAMTMYTVIGIRYEERDLVRLHGAAYEAYQEKVPMLLPFIGKSSPRRNA